MSDDDTLVSLTRQCPTCKGTFGSNVAVCPVDGMMLMPIQSDTLIGSLFADKYRIQSELGRGGMSIVYKGLHELMKRPVAVKIMQRELSSNPVSVRRFQQESEAASRLAHPHVLTVFDFGVTPTAQPYLVMDLVTGTNFAEVLKDERHISPQRALKIFRQICDAMDHAHQRSVVHRDMKPSNVMLLDSESEPDFVKVLDFGIAKIMAKPGEETGNLTTSGEIFGSPLYMSPEQCRGAESDQRTDVYAVGVMLYEALTGQPPIRGSSYIETIQMQISTPPQPFKVALPGVLVPPVLETIAFKAMAKKPDDRYQSMKEFGAALQSASQMLGYEEGGAKGPVQFIEKKSKAGMVAIIGAIVAIVGVAVTVEVMRPAVETTTGTIYYYNPQAHPGLLVLDYGDGSYNILTGNARLEHVFKEAHEPVTNGDNCTVAFHREDKKLLLEEKGTTFDKSSDADIRAVDKLIRKHYENIADGKFEDAWSDFSDQFVQKNSGSKDEVLASWKELHAIEGCESAPDSAIRFLSKNGSTISARVDAPKFVRYEKCDYVITFWNANGQWKFQSLTRADKIPGTGGFGEAESKK